MSDIETQEILDDAVRRWHEEISRLTEEIGQPPALSGTHGEQIIRRVVSAVLAKLPAPSDRMSTDEFRAGEKGRPVFVRGDFIFSYGDPGSIYLVNHTGSVDDSDPLIQHVMVKGLFVGSTNADSVSVLLGRGMQRIQNPKDISTAKEMMRVGLPSLHDEIWPDG